LNKGPEKKNQESETRRVDQKTGLEETLVVRRRTGLKRVKKRRLKYGGEILVKVPIGRGKICETARRGDPSKKTEQWQLKKINTPKTSN